MRNGTYYDDEIFSIESAEAHTYSSLWRFINATDIHPPGSYLIDKLLFNVLGSWVYVKIFAGLLTAGALAIFGALAYGSLSARGRLALGILLMTSGTQVMWDSSVRWYAYFNPIFAVSLAILLFAGLSLTTRTIVLCVSIAIMFHISYLVLCSAPVLVGVHLLRNRQHFARKDVVILCAAGIVASLLCLPQLRTLLSVQLHLQAVNNQAGSTLTALANTATTMFIGDAVFPIAVLPIIYAILILCIFLNFLIRQKKNKLDWLVISTLAIGILALAATGLGVKPRNSAFLLPLVYFGISISLDRIRSRGVYAIIGVMLIFQLVGCFNVVSHRGTIKGSYNTDYRVAMESIEQWVNGCRGRAVVFHHDVVLGYLLKQAEIYQSSPFVSAANDKLVHLSAGDCAVVVKSYRGNYDQATLDRHYAALRTAGLQSISSRNVSYDSNAAAKSRFANEVFPDFLLVMQRSDATTHITLPAWAFGPSGE